MLSVRQSRRRFIQHVGGAVAAGVLTSCSTAVIGRSPKVDRVGVLWFGPDLAPDLPHFAAFRKGLSDLGYVEGQNLTLEWRYGAQDEAKMAQFAQELVGLGVDVLFTPGLLAMQAARQATATIPIVGITNDPVGMGLISSLARPGGNITGMTTLLPELDAKRVEVFKEAVPHVDRIAVFWNPLITDKASDLNATRSAAAAYGIPVQPFEVTYASDLDAAFKGMLDWRANGFVTLMDPYHGSYQSPIADLAMANRIPSMCEGSGFVMLRNGLMSYGPDPFAIFERSASFVDRILKGARPADLPFEQPTGVELALNLQTARHIGVAFPQSILAEADKVNQG